jgi:hypothetical protein
MKLGRRLVYVVPAVAVGVAFGTFGVHATPTKATGAPTPLSITLCGVGTFGAQELAGASNQDHPDSSTFSLTQQTGPCTGTNSSPGPATWTIAHSNADVATEKGTEHGDFSLTSSASYVAGFDGHITDFDVPPFGPADCTSGNRTYFYQSGTETQCPLSIGPIGNFDTHGGASTGQHFWGKYGTLIFQDSSMMSKCPVSNAPNAPYCIQVDLNGRQN